MAQSKEERLFTLTCALLAAGNLGLTKSEIFQAVPGYAEADPGSGLEKQFERDKQSLRESGVLIETLGIDEFMDDVYDSRYRLPRGSFVWPKTIELNSKKLQLLELAARAWNSQSLSQVAKQGLTRLKALGLVDLEAELEVFSPRLLAQHSAFRPLSDAILNFQAVKFDYQKADGSNKTRLVRPWKLRNLEGQWVLLGQDLGDSEPKNFMLRRIYSRVEPLDETFSQPLASQIAAAEESLEKFVQSQTATLRVAAGSEASVFFGVTANVESLVEIHYMDEHLLAEDLREFGSSVEVISPESLKILIQDSLKLVIGSHA